MTALILSHISDCLDEDNRKNAEYQLLWTERQLAFEESLSMQEKVVCIKEFIEQKERMIEAKKKHLDDTEIVEQLLSVMDYIPPTEPYIPYTKNEKCVNMFSVIQTFTNLAREYIDDRLTKLDIYFQSRPALDRRRGFMLLSRYPEIERKAPSFRKPSQNLICMPTIILQK